MSRVQKAVAGLAAGAAGYAGYKLFAGSLKEAMEFEKRMALVRGMLGSVSDADFEALKSRIRAVVTDLGVLHSAGADVAYMLASNAIKADDIDTYARAILGLSKALDANANDIGQTLLRSMAAWKMGADQVEHVTDVLAGMAKVGNMTGGDMAQYFSRFTSEAAGLGVAMEEVGAGFAIATREARPEAAATGMRMLLSVVSKGNETLDQFGARGLIATDGLLGGVEKLVKRAKGNPDLLAKMFPEQNAKMMALVIANNAREMGDAYTQLRTDAGLYEQMMGPVMDTLDSRWGRVKSQMADIGIQFGEKLLPGAKDFSDTLRELSFDPAFIENISTLGALFGRGLEMAGQLAQLPGAWMSAIHDLLHLNQIQDEQIARKQGEYAKAVTDQDRLDYSRQMLGHFESQGAAGAVAAEKWRARVAAAEDAVYRASPEYAAMQASLDRIAANTAPREAN